MKSINKTDLFVCDRIESDVYDLLMVNKEFTDGKDIGLGIDRDSNKLLLVEIETSNVIKEMPLNEESLVNDIEYILFSQYGNVNIDEDLLAEFIASYVVELVEV